MPSLTLQEALRYFFAPFVLYFYFAIFDESDTSRLTQEFGTIGIIAFLVAGSVIYSVYRYLIYDIALIWLKDVFQQETYRTYFGRVRVMTDVRGWRPRHSIQAEKIYSHVSKMEARLQAPIFRVRAAGIHLLYQGSILAMPFLGASVVQGDVQNIAIFAAFFVVLGWAGWRGDVQLEAEELIIVKNSQSVDIALRELGFD